jgi:hypothetical protein
MKYLISGCFFVVILAACNTGSSDLPVSTVEWELGEDGFTQFYTNDPQYYDYSFWSLYNNQGSTTYEIECKKISGHREYAYGMIFAADNSSLTEFYCVRISANGGYGVWMKNGNAQQTAIKGWTKANELRTGYNTTNRIKVTVSGTEYKVYLNDAEVCQISTTAVVPFGTRIGYYVSVGDDTEESFPNVPVDVRFKRK